MCHCCVHGGFLVQRVNRPPGFVAEFFCSSLVAPQVMGERWLMMDCLVDVGYVAFGNFQNGCQALEELQGVVVESIHSGPLSAELPVTTQPLC